MSPEWEAGGEAGTDWCSSVGPLLQQVTDGPLRGGWGRRPLINWPINPSSRIDNAQFARIHAAGDAGTGPHSAAPCRTRRREGGGWRDAEGGGMLVFGGPRHHALCILYLKV